MDILHRVLKWVDYNRYSVLGALLLAVALVIGFGCEPKASWQGQKLTEAEIAVSVVDETAAIEAEADEGQRAVEAKMAIAERLIAEARADEKYLDKSAQRRLSTLSQKFGLAREVIAEKWERLNTLLTLGLDVGTSAMAGNLTAALVTGAIGTALGVLLGRKDKARTDKVAADLKEKLKSGGK